MNKHLPSYTLPIASGLTLRRQFFRKAVPPMMTLRPEIKTFCDAAETLLSPVIMQTPLTEEERAIVKVYMTSLETVILTGSGSPLVARRIF